MANQRSIDIYQFRGNIDVEDGARLILIAQYMGCSISKLIAEIIHDNRIVRNYPNYGWAKPQFVVDNIKNQIRERNKAIRERYDKLTKEGKYRKQSVRKV